MDITEKIDLFIGEEVASSGVAIGTTGHGDSTINLTLLNKKRKKKKNQQKEPTGSTTIYDIFKVD